MRNPFSWLPRAGRTVPIPGGLMSCESWKVCETVDGYEGKITFRIRCSKEEYERATKDPGLLENGALPPSGKPVLIALHPKLIFDRERGEFRELP